MDYFRGLYRKGLIDVKKYEQMIEILDHLEGKNYNFVEVLGEGTYGTVLKVKHSTTHKEYAVKIVSEDHVSEGETTIWPTLQHKNILPLLSCDYVYCAHSYLFLTPVQPSNLEKELFEDSLIKDTQSFTQAIYWLKQILAAVAHLHNKNLSHLDIKCNNVLISDDKDSILTDFGFLTSCEKPVQRYGAPLLYRCPEGWMNEFGFPELDGKKFDVWSMGMMAFEMFTKETLLFEVCKINHPLLSWQEHIYPIIKANIQKEKFTQLMHKAFPASDEINKRADDIINFITSCLIVLPEKRPSVEMLEQHELFGGCFKNVQVDGYEDIWGNKADTHEFDCDFKPDSLELKCDIFPNEGQYNSTYIVNSNKEKTETKGSPYNRNYIITTYREKIAVKDNQFNKTCIVNNNSEKFHVNMNQYNSTYTVSSKEKIKVLSEETVLDATSEKYEYSHCETSDVKSNLDKELHTQDINELDEFSLDHNLSTNISDQVITSNLPEIVLEENSYLSNESENVPDFTSHMTRCQKLRKWWNKRKRSLVKFFTACVNCSRPSSTDEV